MADSDGERKRQLEVSVPIDVEEKMEVEQLPYPDLAPVVLRLSQTSIPRRWFLTLTCDLWLDNMSLVVILINCVFMGMYNPHEDMTNMQVLDNFSMAFFLVEKAIKVLALGLCGYQGSYLSNNWNKLDFLLYSGEVVDYFLAFCGVQLHLRFVLRLMRLVTRVQDMQDLVLTLLDVLPMLSNVLVMYLVYLVVFGIVGVQLWKGVLRNRCFLGVDIPGNQSLSPYFVPEYGKGDVFVCSRDNVGLRHCHDVPPFVQDGKTCMAAAPHNGLASNGCVNWNVYYNVCRQGDHNPYNGAISFDHVGFAMITIFQAVTLEGWVDIMFKVMDAYSFESYIFFMLVTIMGSIIIMNVCAVVIATQFTKSMTRQRRVQKTNPIVLLCIHFLRWLWAAAIRCQNRVHPKRSKNGNAGVLGEVLSPLERAVERMINSRSFEKVIMLAVFLSVLTMAIEHHGQPQEVAEMLNISNIVFAIIFSLELCIKLLALKWGYFSDRNNILDFIIVIVSFLEISSKSFGRLSMLRMLRLLRFVRLLHFLPHLKRQLLVLTNTMKEGSKLYQLMLYVILIFSVVGRALFGGKFKFKTEDGQTINSRMNFDSLHSSMVTVFQVLTEEDWNLVLYDAMGTTSLWACLFFFMIIIVGKHVLLNVMVGIVVKSFQTENGPDEDSDRSLSPPGETFEIAHGPDGSSTSGAGSGRVTDAAPPQTRDTSVSRIRRVLGWCRGHKDWSLFVLSPQNRFRILCQRLISHKMFDYAILVFIILSCVAIAMERPGIKTASTERWILTTSNYVFSAVFLVEMIFKVVALGLLYGKDSYCHSTWNTVDGMLVILSLVSIFVSLTSPSKTNSLGIFKVLRLLRAFRPLRLIKRAQKLKLAVEALMASIKPLGNIALICCTFFFFYGILGVQLFKGKWYNCVGEAISNITNRNECVSAGYRWERKTYNFDNLPQALLTLFVMYSKDGWVTLMYDGVDAAGVDRQPVRNHNEWMVLFFISFMIFSVFLLDMFIGVMVDTFQECQQRQKRQGKAEEGEQTSGDQSRGAEEMPYYANYSPFRRRIHSICTSRVMDHAMNTVVILSILVMALEHYGQPLWMEMLIEISFYVFTVFLIIEVLLKLTAFGIRRYTAAMWNLLDVAVALISIISIILNNVNAAAALINPSIFRVLRALRLAQVLKAKKIQLLLKTIMKTLSQVGNICVLFMFFFFIYAVLGVELFGKLECSDDHPCLGLHQHFNFRHFGMALLTLYQVCTGDNWSEIMKDTLRKCRPGDISCPSYLSWASPIFFATFVMMAQFVLVNLVVGAIMQALEDSYEEVRQKEGENTPESQEEKAAVQ